MSATKTNDMLLLIGVALAVLLGPIILTPIGAGYPDLLQKFAIFGIFAVGFNLLFGLTGYLSFGHAAFLGVGSYAAVWSFKLAGMNIIPAILFSMLVGAVFAVVIGFICLRRSGIYFSILTLAFAQMSYNLAYSVLTPITNGETGLRVFKDDYRLFDGAVENRADNAVADFFGLAMNKTWTMDVAGMAVQFNVGAYVAGIILIIAFYVALRITRSPFGMMLKAIKTNQNRLSFTGVNTRPYLLTIFVISGMYAGLAGGLLAVTDPLAGAERMQWTASGEVVLMTILGGVGTLLGPVLGAGVIKFMENKLSEFNKTSLGEIFSFLPESVQDVAVSISAAFVGEGWHLTLGLMFMLIVIFLPGGLIDGAQRILRLVGIGRRRAPKLQPAE